MRINPFGNIFYAQDDSKMVVLAFDGVKLDSAGGCCKAKDFRRPQ